MPTGLVQPDTTAFLVIDEQERLMPVIHESQRVFDNTNKLIEGARILGVDLWVTEQYPKGLGGTCPEVELGDHQPFEKTCFSCMLLDEVASRVAGKRSLVLCGVEAHICVLKTALDALSKGFEVHVVADAVSSRTPENHRYALERLRQSGAYIVSTEMILFQLMDYAGTDEFKAISRLIK